MIRSQFRKQEIRYDILHLYNFLPAVTQANIRLVLCLKPHSTTLIIKQKVKVYVLIFIYPLSLQTKNNQPIILFFSLIVLERCNYVILNIQIMSLAAQFQNFRDNVRLIFNDRFIGDDGARELAKFIADHRKLEVLEIKSNDISAEGFKEIFEALTRNPSIRQLIVEYNNLGESQYDDWEEKLNNLIDVSPKFERLNISNNKITSEAFKRIVPSLAASKSLKLVEMRYNSINSGDVDYLTGELKRSKNESLLYVELSGNKIKKESIDALEAILKANRSKNPISKDKLLMTGGVFLDNSDRADRSSAANVGTFYMNNKTNAIDQLSRENVVRHLEEILDQNRKDTAEMKVRLEKELEDLLKREKNDARDLQQLENKCNQLVIQNRNLKFQVDRTTSEHQQMERDQELHLRLHDEKLREANKELQQLQQKYEEIQERMQKEHDMKMKEIARQWEGRLRSLQEKIRTVENENNQVENEIKKGLEKRQRIRVEYLQEENIAKNRIEEEEAQRYGLKLSALQAKLREIEQTRQKLIRRNQDLLYEIQKTESNSLKENAGLEQEIDDLKIKEEEFTVKNKQFLTRNEKLKSQIQLKQITIEKLEEELNRLNEEIDLKKKYNKDQVDKIIIDNTEIRRQKQQEKRSQIEKLNELETSLRNAQLENAKLRQEYGVLAQKLHVNLGRAIQDVFSENNLF